MFAFDLLVESTNLGCDPGNTKDGLRDWVQLKGVNGVSVSIWRGRTDFCEYSPDFKTLLCSHLHLHRSIYQWGIFL